MLRKYFQLTFPQLFHTHFFDSALHKTGRGISLSFRVIFCLRKISKDIWLHQNISSIRMKIPISFLYHLKGSSCVSPECVSCLGSYPQKRTEKDENFSFNTTNSLGFPCDIYSSDIHLIHILNNKDRCFLGTLRTKKDPRFPKFTLRWLLVPFGPIRASWKPSGKYARVDSIRHFS